MLQDANYNVVGVTDASGALEQQYSYKPYGEMFAAETLSASVITGEIDPNTQASLLLTTKGHQGLNHMPEIGTIYNRNRILKPKIGRYLQADPNETSLILVTAMMRNAESALLSAYISAGGQQSDGPNLYLYAGSNPVNLRDPSGLTLSDEAYDLASSVQADWFAGFAWATQVLNTGLDVTKGFAMAALSFTPAGIAIDLMDAFATMNKSPGDWDVWDMISVGGTALTAAIPLAKLAKSAFKYFGKGLKSRKGRQIAKLVLACRIRSFALGTLVLMGDQSLRPIEEVARGDYVMTVDEETGDVSPQPVSDTVTRMASDLVSIEVAGQFVKATAEHPFWVVGRGWTEAHLLDVGDGLIMDDNSVVTITNVASLAAPRRVYNLSVWENQNYFVAASKAAPVPPINVIRIKISLNRSGSVRYRA